MRQPKKLSSLYFKFMFNTELGKNLSESRLITALIRLGYIELNEHNKFTWLKRDHVEKINKEIIQESKKIDEEIKNSKLDF